MSAPLAVTALIIGSVGMPLDRLAAAAEKRPMTVSDAIERVQLDVPQMTSRTSVSAPGFSPDYKTFVVRTRHGDLVRNVTLETLSVLNAEKLETYLKHGGERAPTLRNLISIAATEDWHTISGVQWLSESELGFIAPDEFGIAQAFTADVSGKEKTKLTASATSVASYAVSDDTVLYFAYHRSPDEYVKSIGSSSIYRLMVQGEHPMVEPLQLFKRSRTTNKTDPVEYPIARLLYPSIWMSPSGRYAITIAPAINAPDHWSNYKVPHYGMYGYRNDRASSNPNSPALLQRVRFQLIDVQAGTARPLLDAPYSVAAAARVPTVVFWLPGERTVVISNTYLPLHNEDGTACDPCAKAPAIAEVDIQHRTAKQIAWITNIPTDLSHASDRESPSFEKSIEIDLKEGEVTTIAWHEPTRSLSFVQKSTTGKLSEKVLENTARGWAAAPHRRNATWGPPVVITTEEALNAPTVLTAYLRADPNRKKVIYEPNPADAAIEFGRSRVFTWRDQEGLAWTGGLLLPPRYDPRRRYPLIVQTHGFDPTEFLIDGPHGVTTAFAAQAFANVGFVVLQIKENSEAITVDTREGKRVADGYKAAIDLLVSQSIANPSAVGLIGWSRTGFHALHLLANSPDLLAAVTISDAFQGGYMGDILSANESADMIFEGRNVTGGAPNIANISEWFSRHPLYKLSQTRAAIRVEAMGRASLIGMWETYATLKYANKAVDFIYYPKGGHLLRKPAERFGSQAGSVDWFSFWLQGYDDPDPAKTQQHRRWRRLRELRVCGAGECEVSRGGSERCPSRRVDPDLC